VFDKRLGHREVVRPHQFGEQFFPSLFRLLLASRRFEIFANFLPQLLDRLRFAHVFREFIIQVGPLFFLDPRISTEYEYVFP